MSGGENPPGPTSEDITNEFVWHDNSFISGADTNPQYPIGGLYSITNPNTQGSDYVSIRSFRIIRITLPQLASAASVSGLCFYDESQNVMSGVDKATESPRGMVVYELPVPSGAYYVRTTRRIDEGFASFSCIGVY